MSDIFISHVEEDFAVVTELANGLEAAGYSTWFYERDSAGGASYLVQTRDAIVSAQAMALIISGDSLASHQVTKEVVRAHEAHRPIIPLLLGVTVSEYKRRQPEWEEAIGAATSLPIPSAGLGPILPRILLGLEKLEIKPNGPPRQSSAPLAPVYRPAEALPQPSPISTHHSKLPKRVIVAGLIGLFCFFASCINFGNALNPGAVEARIYSDFPAVRGANLLANGVNFLLGGVLLIGCLLVSQSRLLGVRLVRGTAGAMFAVYVLWLAVALAETTTNTFSDPSMDRAMIVGTILTLGVFSLSLTGTVLFLFRKKD
jgi:TIR domain